MLAVQQVQERDVIDKYLQLTQKIKMRLRSIHSFESEKLITARYNQLVFSQARTAKPLLQFEDIARIENCMSQELRCAPEVTYYRSQANHVVFSLQEIPKRIFKMRKVEQKSDPADFSMEERLKNIKKGRVVRKTHNLDRVSVSDAEVVQIALSGKVKDVLVEKKLALSGKYTDLTEEEKREIARQLAIFILDTGASDVAERNFPLCKKPNSEKFKVGLIDLEEMKSAYTGLFGWIKREGLVDLFPSATDVILNEVERKIGIPIVNVSFATDHGPLFDDFPKSKPRLIEIADELYRRTRIAKHFDSEVFVNINKEPFEGAERRNSDTDQIPKDYYDATFLGIVVKEFMRLGLVSTISSRTGHGWVLAV